MLERRQLGFGGERRAGAHLRARARRRQLEFVKDNWLWLAAIPAMFAVVSPVLLLQPRAIRPYLVGAYVASAVWVLVLMVWQLSGVSPLQLGEAGERLTGQQLRPLRRAGWAIIHHAVVRYGDIDHVLVGPAGLVVIETKGGRTDWSDDRYEARLAQAAVQVRRKAGDAGRVVRHVIKDAPATTVVAIWPSPKDFAVRTIDGTAIVPGLELGQWIQDLPPVALDEAVIGQAAAILNGYAERTDAQEFEEHGPPPRSLERWLADIMQYVFGVLLGFLAGAAALELSSLLALLAAGTGVVFAAAAGRYVDAAQRFLYTSAATAALLVVVGVTLNTVE